MKQYPLEAQLEELLSEPVASVINREQSTFDALVAPFGKSYVLFGAGNLGRKTLAGLRKIGVEPLAFTDNNPLLWNQTIDGLQVLSPQDAAHQYGQNAAFIITVWRALGGDRQAQRREQLLNIGCHTVVSFGCLYWKYPSVFLPHYSLDEPHKLYQQADALRKLFFMWEDDASRHEYLAQLRFRMLLDFDGLPPPVAHSQYFAEDIFSLFSEEVFVDVGAFDGDTIREFLKRQGQAFHKLIAFEPDPDTFDILQGYISTLPAVMRDKITLHHLAAGARREKVHFEAKGTVQSAVSDIGSLEVNCAPLDEVLDKCMPTFVKMDIEGAEVDALLGASNIIKVSRPIMPICVYHRPDHLWRVPLFIESLSDQYRFFLRPHDFEGWDLVCYAVPANRLRKS